MHSEINNKKSKSIFSGIKNNIKSSPLYGRTLIILLFVALITKLVIVYFSYKNLNPRENVISYLASDIPVIFFAHLLIIINYWIKKRKFRLINDIIVFVILLLYIIDVFTIFIFHSRVPLVDIFALGSNGSSGFDGVIRLWVIMFVLVGFITFFLVQTKMKFLKKSGKNILIVFSVFSFIYAIFYAIIIISNTNINYVKDIISLNIQKLKNDNVNLDYEEIKLDNDGYQIDRIKGEGKDLNVILVFAESLSAIDSANAGGNDKMPRFDQIQNDGITFTNFVADGGTSDTAHIATLLGVVPLVNMKMGNTPYSGYKLKMQALPDYLNDQGYMTTFVSAASLDFLKQRDFLSWVGFQRIIGEEEFEEDKKYVFGSAPDDKLYDRVLQEVQNQTGKYFIGLQTISFHKPYNTPLGKTEESALQYSDEELFKFYEKLQDLGFFDNGILVIVGDHRKMNSCEENESEMLGPNRFTRSVATVVGSGIKAGTINSDLVQHTDFYSSLKRLLGKGTVEVDGVYNDIFTQKVNRDRGITNAEYSISNSYAVSSYSGDVFLFKSISSLPKDSAMYDYFSTYVSFEFGKQGEKEESHLNEIKFIGHRGANVSKESPENTLESFLSAYSLGADGVEFDVSYTKDGENIVAHGDTLYTSPDCWKQKIGNLNFDWISENCTAGNGEDYKSLKRMLELIDGLFDYYFLEIKVYDEKRGAQQALEAIQTVKDLNMQDRVIFISYSDAAREVLDSDPDIIYGWDTFDVNDLDFIGENNSKYFLAPYDILTPEIVQRARDLGKEVVTYTVNETGDFQAMKDLGVNIIMSDRIDLLKEYNSTRQYPIPHSLEKLDFKKSSGMISEDLNIWS